MNITNMFGRPLPKEEGKTIACFLDECKQESAKYNKAIVIFVDDYNGSWQTKWSVYGMTPAELNFMLDLTKIRTLEEMRK
jgi:hypothetical protein